MKLRRGSPLFVWALVLVFATAALALIVLYAETTSRPRDLANAAMVRLNSVRFERSKLNIVIIGDSLMECAFPRSQDLFNNRLTQEFRRNGCELNDINVVNLAYSGCKFPVIEDYFQDIINLRPQALVLQLDLVAPWQEARGLERISLDLENVASLMRPVLLSRFRAFSKEIRKPLDPYLPALLKPAKSKVSSMTDVASINLDSADEAVEIRPQFRGGERLENKLDTVERGVTSSDDLRVSEKLIRTAVQSGIKVIVLETPRSLLLTSRLSKNSFDERKRLVKQLCGKYDAAYFEVGRVFPDIYFRDSRHLNNKGMGTFLSWFSKEFVQQHLQQHPCRI